MREGKCERAASGQSGRSGAQKLLFVYFWNSQRFSDASVLTV